MGKHKKLNKVLVIGSGPIVIGQAAEFDYAGTQACLALKEEGIEVVLVNNNPATIMTDTSVADYVYMEPLDIPTLEKIIAKERPDGMIGSLGGQTALNLTIKLDEKGILKKYNVELLGTSVKSIQNGEDRDKFRQLMIEIAEPIAESKVVESVQEGLTFIEEIGYPVILRPAYTLGGEGGGFAYNEQAFINLLDNAITLSPIHQVLVEKSIKGWKEIEFEVIRDASDACVIVCDMENVDPVGVHTGDSIVVAPSQTLKENQYQLLRAASMKVIRALEIVGGCNIQFALHPETNDYCIIEVNPRVSRSSALASKATGYPIARITTKCAIGYRLSEMKNPISGETYATFEPSLDYVVVKLPRFPFDKFTEADRTLGTQMKATGEVMATDLSFAGALNKAVRSLEMNVTSLSWPVMSEMPTSDIIELLKNPNDLRLFAIGEAFTRNMDVEEVQRYTEIDAWFLEKIAEIIACEQLLQKLDWPEVSREDLIKAKRLNISDARISALVGTTPSILRKYYKDTAMRPTFREVKSGVSGTDTIHSYYYSTWQEESEAQAVPASPKILVLGSGPIRIGQGIEFDYCSVHAAQTVKKLGYDAVIINNNPETVSTDYYIADHLYFEPLAIEDVLTVIEKENAAGVLIQFGGQTAINLANDLKAEGIHIYGTSPEHIDQMEDREQFYDVLEQLEIPHINGKIVHNSEELDTSIKELGFPVLIRPSYVIGGQSMFICNKEEELKTYVQRIQKDTFNKCWPLLIDSYLPGLECEMDIISDGKDIIIPGIMEHIEKAGVHSGDSISVFPPITITEKMKEEMTEMASRISRALPIVGIMNIQFVIHQNTIYVLEVNPRSSRTVPIISKVTGIPIIEWAVKTQLGTPISEITGERDLLPEPNYVTVKAPIFSASKLKGVDHILGPEMKSTGEIIGLGWTKNQALKRVASYIGNMKEKVVGSLQIFVSISDRMKQESLELILELNKLDSSITATKGTAEFLAENGIDTSEILKNKTDLLRHWQENTPDIVLNIPNQGREKEKIGFYIRELSVRYQTPYFTSLETLKAMIDCQLNQDVVETPLSIQDYLDQLSVKN
ncbi:carbamoyl-phosphate synthase (glutamine-hydrolyzing) large subunit [Oceanobacillus chungangensis]|uniref:Carbamoyl-phosphate synthase large subunit n=1 Tax=Oceanobacillus chungangensis TaxID=1229152 RepID=A0A3D8PUN9_9BACI|nr:carbamoyl-phosphate synthase (glutamine-hydrolyzing) large subunit [Oceanobacillus chungangensis]RDW19833.1 carbamoyl-phosphate synthase large subunit [Oceanobacillus chungangensis]